MALLAYFLQVPVFKSRFLQRKVHKVTHIAFRSGFLSVHHPVYSHVDPGQVGVVDHMLGLFLGLILERCLKTLLLLVDLETLSAEFSLAFFLQLKESISEQLILVDALRDDIRLRNNKKNLTEKTSLFMFTYRISFFQF